MDGTCQTQATPGCFDQLSIENGYVNYWYTLEDDMKGLLMYNPVITTVNVSIVSYSFY